ncbi:MAG TPA: response regulator [Gammaproteobacteria bacterium]|nr:response regulator [Gammaproteobacteria bacterium]
MTVQKGVPSLVAGSDAPVLTVLFVDHSRVSQAVWDRVILRLGHHAVMARTAGEALTCAADMHIDAVCTALSLPDMDGIGLCRRLRADPRHAALPIILLTSRNDPEIRARCRSAGVTDIQAKSDVERLLRRLRSYADQADASVQGRVLYVEDSEVTARVVDAALRELNLVVDRFHRPDAALAAFNVHDYDLVITSVAEDDAAAMDLIGAIRDFGGRRGQTPIIATAGEAARERKSMLFRLGIDDFLAKPAAEEEIVARVGNLVRAKLLADQLRAERARVRELALIDSLTGLLNAASLHELGPKYVADAARHDQSLSLLLVVIDKPDDAAITGVAHLLRDSCRGEDLATRHGDRSFAILLPHCDERHARLRGSRLQSQIAALKPVNLTARIGVGAFEGETGLAFGDMFAAAQRDLPNAQHESDTQRDQQSMADIDGPPAHRPAR